MAHRCLQITLELPGDQRPAAEAALLETGAVALTLEDAGDEAILEPAPGETPDWTKVRISGAFRADVDAPAILATLHERFGITARISHAAENAPPPPMRPARFGKQLWVTPGDGHKILEDAVVVLLEPGLAFGTGAHPTTAACLRWLDNHPPVGMTVVDYGCGSGILGIAAAKLGAHKVICVDHDPQALEVARENSRRNRCPDRIVVQGPDAKVPDCVDLVLANIVARPLLELGERFAGWLADGGHIVLAGLLPEQGDALAAFYLRWFEINEVTEEEGWVLITGTRRRRAG